MTAGHKMHGFKIPLPSLWWASGCSNCCQTEPSTVTTPRQEGFSQTIIPIRNHGKSAGRVSSRRKEFLMTSGRSSKPRQVPSTSQETLPVKGSLPPIPSMARSPGSTQRMVSCSTPPGTCKSWQGSRLPGMARCSPFPTVRWSLSPRTTKPRTFSFRRTNCKVHGGWRSARNSATSSSRKTATSLATTKIPRVAAK